MSSTQEIDALIEMMAKLPGLGPRSARRAVLHLIRKRALLFTPLADLMQTVAVTLLQVVSLTPGEVPAWHDDRTSSELELPRRVCRRLEIGPGTVVPRLEPGPGTVVPRLEPGPETVVSTGEPSIPVSNDQFKQCMDTHVHEDAGKIPPGDDFMQAWWKAQRQYVENSTHEKKKNAPQIKKKHCKLNTFRLSSSIFLHFSSPLQPQNFPKFS